MMLCTAACLTLGLHIATAHDTGGKQGVNPGLYARTADGLTAGAYRNSYDRLSVYGGYTFETPNKRWALTLGAVSGYGQRRCAQAPEREPVSADERAKPLMASAAGDISPVVGEAVQALAPQPGGCGNSKRLKPLVAGSLRLPVTELSAFRLTLLPKARKLGGGALHLSWETDL